MISVMNYRLSPFYLGSTECRTNFFGSQLALKGTTTLWQPCLVCKPPERVIEMTTTTEKPPATPAEGRLAALEAAWRECAFHKVLPAPHTLLSWCMIAKENGPDEVLRLLLQAETNSSLHPAIKRAWNNSLKTEAVPTKELPEVSDDDKSTSKVDRFRDWLGGRIGTDQPLFGHSKEDIR